MHFQVSKLEQRQASGRLLTMLGLSRVVRSSQRLVSKPRKEIPHTSPARGILLLNKRNSTDIYREHGKLPRNNSEHRSLHSSGCSTYISFLQLEQQVSIKVKITDEDIYLIHEGDAVYASR